MKIENFNIEQFKKDFYEFFSIDKYNRDWSIKQFCKDYSINEITLWRTLNGKHKNVNTNYHHICDLMGKRASFYYLDSI